jgi:hypothetical protein
MGTAARFLGWGAVATAAIPFLTDLYHPDGKMSDRLGTEAIGENTMALLDATVNRLDARRAPSTHQIAMSLVVALVTSRMHELTDDDRGLVGRMLVDLQSRGFSVVESRAMLRRLRNRIVDPADRECEADSSAVL